jgi:hypothetical protein
MSQKKAQEVQEILSTLSLKDQVETLANVLINIGLQYMETNSSISKEDILITILKDRDKYGETIPNALALQGATMLLWITK